MERGLGDVIDSTCGYGVTHPSGENDVCGDYAVTWVELTKGTRRYLCADHADEVERFGDDTDDHPLVSVCSRCGRLTPEDYIDPFGVCDDCQDSD